MRARFILSGVVLFISSQAAYAEACPWPRQKGMSCRDHKTKKEASGRHAKATSKRHSKLAKESYSAKDTGEGEVETLHSAQAAVAFSAAENSTADAKAMKNGLFSQNRGIEIRPSVAMQWFSVQNNRADSSLIRTNWLGVKGELDTAVLRFPIMELGGEVTAFRSLSGLNAESTATSATDFGASVYTLWKANTSWVGIPMLRVAGGYYGNWREGSFAGFLPSVSGLKLSTEVSAIIDAMFAFGVNGAYTFSHQGLYDLGAFLSQKFISSARAGIWSAKLGANVSLLMAEERRESWISVHAGVSAAF